MGFSPKNLVLIAEVARRHPLKVELVFLLVKFWKFCNPIIIYNRASADYEQMLQISAQEIAM